MSGATLTPFSGTENFVPEIWLAAIQEPYRKSMVFAREGLMTTPELGSGQVLSMGDTIHITNIGNITVRDYNANQDLEIDDLSTTARTIKIDQGKYFNFRIEDVAAVQAAGPLRDPAVREAAQALADGTDKHIAKRLHEDAGTKIPKYSIYDGESSRAPDGVGTAFQALAKLNTALNVKNAPQFGRVAFVGPKTYEALLLDKRFTRVDASGTSEGLRNGIVGRAIGFDVVVTNNIHTVASREVLTAVVPGAVQFISQINKVEMLRSESRFASNVRGLNVWGVGIVRPDGIATLEADITAGASD